MLLTDEALTRAEEKEADEGGGRKEYGGDEPVHEDPNVNACAEYWICDAPRYPDARELSRRLKFKFYERSFATKASDDVLIGILAVVRRLVVTGEDRKQNFAYLFGPKWLALSNLWRGSRLDLLRKARMMAGGVFTRVHDANAPFFRPRRPDIGEEQELEEWEVVRPQIANRVKVTRRELHHQRT